MHDVLADYGHGSPSKKRKIPGASCLSQLPSALVSRSQHFTRGDEDSCADAGAPSADGVAPAFTAGGFSAPFRRK